MRNPNLIIVKKSGAEVSTIGGQRKKSTHTRPRKPDVDLDQYGRLRVANMLAILNVSHATFYAGVKTGRYPSPDGRDGSFPYWMTSTVKAFLES